MILVIYIVIFAQVLLLGKKMLRFLALLRFTRSPWALQQISWHSVPHFWLKCRCPSPQMQPHPPHNTSALFNLSFESFRAPLLRPSPQVLCTHPQELTHCWGSCMFCSLVWHRFWHSRPAGFSRADLWDPVALFFCWWRHLSEFLRLTGLSLRTLESCKNFIIKV